MAEGLVNHFLGDVWHAYSAGTDPAGYVHALAVEAMAELGIDISGQESKAVDPFRDVELDLVVTVCDGATERCPVWLGQGVKVHMGYRDPATAAGTHLERLAVFRQVRDEMRQQVLAYLAQDRLTPTST
jgi:arsenate reductase